MSNILFVCRYNRFRSIIAEAFFNKYNKNKANSAKSAGLALGSPLSENVRKIALEFGLKIKKSPEKITPEIIKLGDLMVIVADDVPRSLFDYIEKDGKKIVVWGIQDARGHELDDIRGIARDVEKKVIRLINELNTS